jgi:L-threonylcarbamoyladenylate synthase
MKKGGGMSLQEIAKNCEILQASSGDSIVKAASLLRRGELVALPTETVYGLAANARNTEAVEKIYEVKNRPSFNPLIVHVASLAMAERFAVFNPLARQLAEAFWPGPLTLVLPVNSESGLSPLVMAGLETVAIRVPSHPFMHQLLEESGLPLAAPSANPSGFMSPVTADHVLQGLGDKIPLIIDGGACSVGVESTILGFDEQGYVIDPVLLRAGGLSREQIEQVIAPLKIISPSSQGSDAKGKITAPGQLTRHYAPLKPLRLNAIHVNPNEALLAFGTPILPGAGALFQLSTKGNLEEAASRLFLGLHTLSHLSVKTIAVMPIPRHGVGEAINDRLMRAAASV